jgi:hypothetical protein
MQQHPLAPCTAEQISDLNELMAMIRSWPGIREAKPGVFYIKQDPFMHVLTDLASNRWINARRGVQWGKPLAVPSTLAELDLRRLMREIKDRYLRTAFALSRRVVA